jgi:hypothetical protein
VPSPEQQAWQTITAEVRAYLALRVPEMADMKPAELLRFLEAMDTAQDLEVGAAGHDERVNQINRYWEK